MRMKMTITLKSSSWLAKISRLLISAIILCTVVGLGWLQPSVADAETLTAGPTTAITPTNPAQNTIAQYVVMSRITVSSTGAGDGLVTLASVTINNPGTAGLQAGRVFISSNSTSTTMPSDALEIGKTRGLWSAGTTTVILLSNGTTTTQRSVFTNTPKYLYIAFDMAAAGTVQASVTGIGVAGGDTPATGLTSLSNLVNVAASGVFAKVTVCTDCHGLTLLDNTTRSAATGSFVGSHNKHVDSRQLICASCHVYPISTSSTDHRNGYINMAGTFSFQASAGNSYSKASGPTYSFLQSSAATSATAGTCSNLYCHSNAIGTSFATPTWGKPATGACGTCHGVNGSSPASYPASTRHAQHVGSAQGYKYACSMCHNRIVTVTSDATVTPQISAVTPTLHVSNTHNIDFDSFNSVGTYSLSPQQCSNLYCHSRGTSAVTSRPVTTAAWGITLDCAGCHGAGTTQTSLLTTNAHSAHINDSVKNKIGRSIGCKECHNATASTDTTIGNAGNHVNKLLNIKFDNSALLPNSDGPLYNGVSTTLTTTGAVKTPGTAGYSCSNVYCHSSGNLMNASGTGTIVVSGAAPTFTSPVWNGAALNCDACHGNQGGGKAHPVYATGSGGSTTANSHVNHVESSGISCDACHMNTTVSTATTVATMTIVPGGLHLNRVENVTFNTAKAGASATWVFASKTCNASSCHGTNSGAWGANTNNATCVKCHGVPNATPPQYTLDTRIAAPGFVSTAPIGTGLSTAGAFTYTDPKVGMHDSHLRSVDGISKPVACTECHKNVLTTSASFTNHMNGAGSLDWGPLALTGGSTPTYVGGNCTSNYCHTANRPPGAAAGQSGLNNPFTWNTPTILGTSIANSCTNKCHAMPPGFGVSGDTHQSIPTVSSAFTTTVLNQCSSSGTGCHPTITAGGASLAALFTNGGASHINGQVEGGTCPSCHASPQTSATLSAYTGGTRTRRDALVSREFGTRWGHRKSSRSAVTDQDCIVCHLEGEATSKQTTTYHKDGYINLRDPDGVGEQQITNMASSAVFSFVTFTIGYTAGSRTANGENLDSIANVLTQKFCLACHDANGATNTYAWTTYTTGTVAKQYMPFGGVFMGATYTALTGATTTGGLVNVKSQFTTTYSSVHPVRGSLNRDYPFSTRLNTPYNNILGSRTTTSHTKAFSVVISCFDCHNQSSAQGTLTTRTNVAHGSSTTPLRGTIYATSATLCGVCHSGYTITGMHGSGSAMASNTNRNDEGMDNTCQTCHGSQLAYPARPRAAQDYHGFNSLAGGGLWPTVNARPYAFIRAWVNAYHRPYRATEFTTGSAVCGGTGSTCPLTGAVGDGSNRNYTPGGSY